MKQEAIELSDALNSVPVRWRWARLGDSRMTQRVAGATNAIADVQRDSPWPEGATIFGGAGIGKTSLAVAMFHAWIETQTAIALETRKTARFLAARRLPAAKMDRTSEYDVAIGASLIVLDDLGAEGDMPHARAAVTDVLAERHAWNLPTLVTTFLDEPGLVARYGDGVARRLFEHTCVVRLGA